MDRSTVIAGWGPRVRRADILAAGITLHEYRKAVQCGVLRRIVTPGCRKGRFERDDVLKVFDLEGVK